MRVGYKKAWGVADRHVGRAGLAAIASLITGIGYLTRTYFEVGADRIIVFALIGPLRREYPTLTQPPT